ncbi:putative bifunctional diguanylate cyclase/phosphodiesterase [Solibacillus silvestris]|uniref:putative bifunctional diguanylate cyclase/phosphodiesterase n=1 Tax=Solibacillus silvestris TaxID=76853 RepID=UPI003F7E1F12
MEGMKKSGQIEKMLQFFENINEIIVEDNNFAEKVKRLCGEIDIVYATYSTFTYIKENQIPLILSSSYVHNPANNKDFLSDEERCFYEELLNQKKTLCFSEMKSLKLHQNFYMEAIENGCDACYYIPVYTMQKEAIGFLVIYYQSNRVEHINISGFEQRIEKIIQTIHKLELSQNQIERLTLIDPHTNLPSYTQFLKLIDEHTKRNDSGIIKIVEPGEFSKIVELYGRPAGEKLLKELGARIKRLPASKNSEIARFTSSSLIIFKPDKFDPLNTKYKVSIIEAVNDPFYIDGKQIYITLKIGIAPFDHSSSYHDVIRFAESALTKSKLVSGTYTNYYIGQANQHLERELNLLNYLKTAIQRNEIKAYFQPKFELHRGRIVSMEALARWISPELGFVSPAEFIPIAESSGLIRELELQIFEQVLQWQQQRQFEGKRIVPVAINISPDHFYHPLFIKELKQLISKYYADPGFLIIEITENMGLVDFDYAKKILTELREMGMTTSVDDFGTGYSSLSYLQKFSFCELKIDQSFSQKIEELATQTIVKSIIRIAHMLDMVVVAEGVETQEQADILKKLRCDVLQGYYFSKPLPIKEATELYDRLRMENKRTK